VEECPTRLTAFPFAATGAEAPSGTWVPDATPSDPDVDDPVAPDVAGAEPVSPVVAAPVDPRVDESPRTVIALPLAVTGAEANSGAWVPEATPSDPEVVAVSPALESTGADVPPDDSALESPTTEMALPVTVTGAVISAGTWVPDATPSVPDVVDDPSGPEPAAACGVASGAPPVDEFPTTLIAF
jgi:hypothetical protein